MNQRPTQIQTPKPPAQTDRQTADESREEKLQAALNEVAEVVASDRPAAVKVAQLTMTLSGCEDEGLIKISSTSN